MSSLADRLKKVAKQNKYSSVLASSKSLDRKPVAITNVPMINVALSGKLDDGLYPGILQIVGESRTFKTCFSLILMAAYLKKHPDGYALFFDSEGGASFEYFDTFGIDKSRVIHLPIEDIEDLKIQVAGFLKEIEQGDKCFIFIDSVGLLPSRKEVEDAEDGKTVADMTRARALNSFWRIVTTPLKLKELPLVAINHFYETMEMHSKDVIKGGKGGFWASDDIWKITRSQIKDGTELSGWSFNIKVLKSRKVRENSRIPIEVLYDGGIDVYSGLLEVARATGHVDMPTKGFYTRPSIPDDKKWRRSAMDGDWWKPILEDESFGTAVTALYTLSGNTRLIDNLEHIIDDIHEISEYVDTTTGEIIVTP